MDSKDGYSLSIIYAAYQESQDTDDGKQGRPYLTPPAKNAAYMDSSRGRGRDQATEVFLEDSVRRAIGQLSGPGKVRREWMVDGELEV